MSTPAITVDTDNGGRCRPAGRAADDQQAAPVIGKYTGVLAAADVVTESTTFWLTESIRIDLGYGSQAHL